MGNEVQHLAPSGLLMIVVTVIPYTSGNSVLINVRKEEICVHWPH